MTIREIQSHLEEMYGTEVSPTLISSVTEAVMEEVKAWQARPLDALYPIVYLDCIHAKVRDSGAVRVKAVFLALGVNLSGEKELLGLPVAFHSFFPMRRIRFVEIRELFNASHKGHEISS